MMKCCLFGKWGYASKTFTLKLGTQTQHLQEEFSRLRSELDLAVSVSIIPPKADLEGGGGLTSMLTRLEASVGERSAVLVAPSSVAGDFVGAAALKGAFTQV